MARKPIVTVLTALLIVMLAVAGLPVRTARADGSTEFPILVEIRGTIQTLTFGQLIFTDGAIIKFTQNTRTNPPTLVLRVGLTVVIEAEFETDEFVARTIALVPGAPIVIIVPPTATPIPTLTPTPTPVPVQGKGKGKDNAPGKGNNKDKGKGDRDITECLKNTTHPVATRLATGLVVPYVEIMTWHCKGYGFAEVARAYLLARKSPLTVQQILEARKAGKGWGNILKVAGVNPKDFALGQIIGKGKNK